MGCLDTVGRGLATPGLTPGPQPLGAPATKAAAAATAATTAAVASAAGDDDAAPCGPQPAVDGSIFFILGIFYFGDILGILLCFSLIYIRMIDSYIFVLLH